MSDTPVIISNCSTDFSSKNDLYFPINWYESYASDMSHYTFTNWKPYAPRFISSYNDLSEKDAFHRIEKLAKDRVATGVIIYNQLNDEKAPVIINEIVNSVNIEYYIQIYDKIKGKSTPLKNFPRSQAILKNNPHINWYFIDDFNECNWTSDKSKVFSRILRLESQNKYLMSASGLDNYLGNGNYLLDDVDIIAPQLYPLLRTVTKDQNLNEAIPKFYGHQSFHKRVLKGKNLVIDYNKTHNRKIYYFVTLAIYHNNRKNFKATVARFPTYSEFRFQFFDAIIGGAKGINIYSNFSCSKESYESAKRVISEFRNSGFEQAVVNGIYSPSAIQIINVDRNCKENDIDYCCYNFQNELYIIFSNISNIPQRICFELKNVDKFISEEFPYANNIYCIKKQKLHFNPFEIKLIRITNNN